MPHRQYCPNRPPLLQSPAACAATTRLTPFPSSTRYRSRACVHFATCFGLGIADAFSRTRLSSGHNITILTRGVIVEPLRGRLVVFTGGGENYHAPLAVTQGRRSTFHAWFKCACNMILVNMTKEKFDSDTSYGEYDDEPKAVGSLLVGDH